MIERAQVGLTREIKLPSPPEGLPQVPKRRLSRKGSLVSNASNSTSAAKSTKPTTSQVETSRVNPAVARSATPQNGLPSSTPVVAETQHDCVLVQSSQEPPQPSLETQKEWTDAQPCDDQLAISNMDTPISSPAPKKKKMVEARWAEHEFHELHPENL